MADPKPFIFVCGPDDFLVGRLGRERYDALAREIDDEFSRETISGFANNVAEVETAVNQFREALQTISMFGGRRLVWLKDVNFLADTVTSRAESTLKQVEALQELLTNNDPANVAVLITAAPIDRRRSFPKWAEKNGDFTLVGGDGDASALAGVIVEECKTLGVTIEPGAIELLLAKVGANTRLLIEEVRKLSTSIDEGAAIGEDAVAELTPNVAEGDFFEAAEAFFSGDITWTLTALKRHFFNGGDSRPILSALQNRNRILIQVRALVDAGDARLGGRGLDGLKQAAGKYADHFVGATAKSGYNVFTQNAWYVGKLASGGKLPTTRRLIDNQQEFLNAFEEIIRRPNEQEDVLRDMAVRCLAA
ncbi:DNA polymerase III subunit delta [Synoicihabitans lomoniglobus]|uniref:DNA polymerase III subunit delta n=1 Tax=Synoicihabitans lomoniglobus TaxID=2909285 RepID=A0AAF0A1B4_9BACT|nr:DNA polymerase III subunit delta [Opitutaceae bacterium LMO-M01]WED64882.1 DNA polymerase III subunit delta [Opitutaceae bacterium LMO-M01]